MKILTIHYDPKSGAFEVETNRGTLLVSYEFYQTDQLHASEIVDDEKAARILQEDQRIRAVQKAMRFALYQPRTEGEVRLRLAREKYPAETIDAAIAAVKRAHLLDDAQYAKRFAEDKSRLKHWSRRHIEEALRQKGCDRETILNALHFITESAEIEAVAAIVEKSYRRRDLSDPKEKSRTVQALLRRGFSGDAIRRVIEKKSREDADADEFF